jgi:LysR family transcriptional regulator for metE and metH
MPVLELKHLSTLLALAETGSLTRAAGTLGITQSAVTHRISEAQRRLGVTLVKKSGRRVFLTPAAERLQSVGLRTLAEIDRVEREVTAEHGEGRHWVRFGQAVSSRYRWLPGFLKQFENVLRDIELDLVARATFQPLQMLHDGAVDVLSISGLEGASGAFEWIHLMKDPLVVILPPGHPLAQSKRIRVSALNDERFLMHSAAREPGFDWQGHYLPKTLSFRHTKEVQVPEAIIDLVEVGIGVSILPRWIVEPELANGRLIARPLEGRNLWTDWWAVIRSNEPAGSATRRVVAALVEWCDRPGSRRPSPKLGQRSWRIRKR